MKKWQKFPTKAILEVKFDRIIIFLEPRQTCFNGLVILRYYKDYMFLIKTDIIDISRKKSYHG